MLHELNNGVDHLFVPERRDKLQSRRRRRVARALRRFAVLWHYGAYEIVSASRRRWDIDAVGSVANPGGSHVHVYTHDATSGHRMIKPAHSWEPALWLGDERWTVLVPTSPAQRQALEWSKGDESESP